MGCSLGQPELRGFGLRKRTKGCFDRDGFLLLRADSTNLA